MRLLEALLLRRDADAKEALLAAAVVRGRRRVAREAGGIGRCHHFVESSMAVSSIWPKKRLIVVAGRILITVLYSTGTGYPYSKILYFQVLEPFQGYNYNYEENRTLPE